jgi:glycosyltransferase involved in cell wall biosynthesis
LVPRKRLDLLLEAFKLLLKERSDVQLYIVGRFVYAKGYQQLLEIPELNHQVTYIEHMDRAKIPAFMGSVDILVQPSESENFGSAVAEALCYGIPVIVGSTNGTKDYISPSSFIFEEYTPQSVKDIMLKAIDSLERLGSATLAKDARQTAEKQFSPKRVVSQLEDIFEAS